MKFYVVKRSEMMDEQSLLNLLLLLLKTKSHNKIALTKM